MQEIFKGFLMLRMLAFIPLLIIILVLVGISALGRGDDVLGIAALAGVQVIVMVVLVRLLVRRAGQSQR